MSEFLKIKIEIWSGLGKAEIELNDNQLLVLKSSIPEWNDPGEVFHGKLNDIYTVKRFGNLIIGINEEPSEKREITILDGIEIKVQLRKEKETIKFTLSSIQDNSKEMKFVDELFAFTSELINNEELTKYLHNIKQNYLS